jgi:hypothetical protein
MLDYLAIFTKGGALLWAWQLSALQVGRSVRPAYQGASRLIDTGSRW